MNITPIIAIPRVSMPSPGCRYSDRKEKKAAIQRRIAKKWVNWEINLRYRGLFLTSFISFRPYSWRRLPASSSESPLSEVTRLLKTSSFERFWIFIDVHVQVSGL